MGSMLTKADKHRSKTKLLNMSVKVKDVLNVYRKNKLDRTLGLIDHPKQYRICGQVFNSVSTTNFGVGNRPVYSYAKPFNVYVHTDSAEASSNPPETLNRGFCLNFVQQPCTSSSG